jgi:hypothetical protein
MSHTIYAAKFKQTITGQHYQEKVSHIYFYDEKVSRIDGACANEMLSSD